MQSVFIAGVKVSSIKRDEALRLVRSFLFDSRQHTIFTPNPEMIVKAHWDEYFRAVLNSGDLNLCDGRGLQLVSRQKLERIAGVDFVLDICGIAAAEGKSIFLLGSGSEEVVKAAADNLQKNYPSLKTAGWNMGPDIKEILNIEYSILESGLEISSIEQEKLITKINVVKPVILFVAFGMGKQEKWIYENLTGLPSVKIAVGVGGSFDYLAGFNYLGKPVRRAPLLMRKMGLEWLYRVFKEPQRAVRIFNATLRFLYTVMKGK